jgi:hypothetical protein
MALAFMLVSPYTGTLNEKVGSRGLMAGGCRPHPLRSAGLRLALAVGGLAQIACAALAWPALRAPRQTGD